MSNIIRAVAAIIGVAAIILLVLLLRSRPSEPPVAVAEPAMEAPKPTAVAPPPTPDSSAEIQGLKGRLAEEMRARQRAAAEAAALRQQIPSPQSNMVASLVKADEMGKRTGAFLPALGELHGLTGRDRATLSPDERRRLLELQRDQAKLLGALPEITAYQDKPEEYGRFF